MSKKFIALSIVALLAGGTALAKGPSIGKLAKDLDLTEEQSEYLESRKADKEADRESRKAEMESRRAQSKAAFQAELRKDSPDVDALHGMIDERAAERANREHERLDEMLAFHATLSPEQREQLVEKMEERGERGHRGGHKGERGRGGPGADQGEDGDGERGQRRQRRRRGGQDKDLDY